MLVRRAVFVVILSTLPWVFLAGAATAAENSKISGSFSFTAHHICADPIRVDSSYDETMHVYVDSSGTPIRLAFTGTVTALYTDLVTGTTYEPSSSGPGTVDLATGQSISRGGNGFVFNSDGVLVATDGRVVFDANGNVISVIHHETAVCAALGTTPV
jgi:hypothetical protein